MSLVRSGSKLKLTGRILGSLIILFAITGEITRLISICQGDLGFYLFGADNDNFRSRVIYLVHVILFLNIAIMGLLTAVGFERISQKYMRLFAISGLLSILVRPFMWFLFMDWPRGEERLAWLFFEMRTEWFNYKFYPIPTTIGTSIGGILLLLTLIANLIVSFASKNSSYTSPSFASQQQQHPQRPIYQQQQYVQPPQPPVQQSMIAELAELERMFESGALTKPEFTAAKKRVLGQ
jgi:hypothetical protein